MHIGYAQCCFASAFVLYIERSADGSIPTQPLMSAHEDFVINHWGVSNEEPKFLKMPRMHDQH